MSKIQPEKYYEACITHHLVNYFQFTLDKKIYPFSISQIEEKLEGYDFGYEISEKAFFIQYKRPYRVIPEDTYYWKIDIEQLQTINSKVDGINTYYALPSFGDSAGWYEALENTFFINALSLETQIKKISRGKNVKTISINSEKIRLDNWKKMSRIFTTHLNNVVMTKIDVNEDFDLVLNSIHELDEDTKSSTWMYILEEDK
ncbi:hypothetical protein [Bacillus toyonensis]|uniref:hypothetical protein n=1 Tax=Bacillus toyonensis TaxID=155322 RepID=UPI000BEB9735|nr:hypothetical protein [Bacillus toyonensis]PED16879.1 hypothetical protein CON63_29160 [Bacillus toyonensis]